MAIIMQKIQPELPPKGTFSARCYQMIHIGTIPEEFKGQTKHLNKVRISFELPTEQKTFSEEKGEQPFVISQEYTLSMSQKSKLKAVLEAWRGESFSNEEMKGFDITEMVGEACLITIAHKESENGNIYATITGVTQPIKGMEIPPLINQPCILSFDDDDFITKFNTLPEFIQEKIKTSKEYTQLTGEIQDDTSKH